VKFSLSSQVAAPFPSAETALAFISLIAPARLLSRLPWLYSRAAQEPSIGGRKPHNEQ